VCSGADHDVAELARPDLRPVEVDREREHVGRPSIPRCSALSARIRLSVDELDRDVPVVDARRRERDRDEAPQRLLGQIGGADDLDLEHYFDCRLGCCAGRSSGAARWECSS
jgi:hypothetical protein